MTATLLSTIVPTWVSNWLTPLWILGVGALLGLTALLILWAVVWLLSRIPWLAALATEPRSRTWTGVVIGSILFVLLAVLFVWPAFQNSPDNLVLGVCLLLPFSLAVGLGVVAYWSPKTVGEAFDAVREGPLGWLLVMVLGLAAFGLVGVFLAMEPRAILASLARVPYIGERDLQFTVPATPRAVLDDPGQSPPQHPIAVDFRAEELRSIVIRSDQNLNIDSALQEGVETDPLIEISAGEDFSWIRGAKESPLGDKQVQSLYVRNLSAADAHLQVTLVTAPPHPESLLVLVTALVILGVFLAYLFQRAIMPKVSAVALATFKSEVNQPLFMIVLIVGLVALALFIFIPYNTFGEDIKVLKDSGMTLIMVLCIILAVWAASTSVADEIDGRTALTVLSKPIGRRSFILGKYLGILWTVLVVFAVLGLCLLICVAYKPIYDAREGSAEDPTWQVCNLEMLGVVPGLVLALMETGVLAAISVAISTRLPMLANFIICFSIYVLGHLTPLVVQSSVGMFEAVRFVAELTATVLPNLEHFNIQAAVAAGVAVPGNYLAWALLYSLIYGVIALLLALVLFEDRDLA
jgi:ABC-type transport system involved in multi-copper enzyme maturation permease subunit